MAIPEGYRKLGVVGYSDRGDYSPQEEYGRYMCVYHGGSTWVCTRDGTSGLEPGTDGTAWRLMARGDAQAVAEERQRAEAAESANADAITRLTPAGNAGAHNAIYRGEHLGTAVTAEQWSAIKAGTFDGMYVGDYWLINDVRWRVAAFDYFLYNGDTQTTTHHAVVVPDILPASAKMNDTDTTAGGYAGSQMRAAGMNYTKNVINSSFGEAHVLKHRQLLSSDVANGKATVWMWFDTTVELMDEAMLMGRKMAASDVSGPCYGQLPLFALNNLMINCGRANLWLRDVYSATSFAELRGFGNTNYRAATISSRIRPVFAICG